MKRITAIAASLLLIVCTHAEAADKYETDPKKWKVIPRPTESDWDGYHAFLHRANFSKHEWVIDRIEGKIVALLKQDFKPTNEQSPNFDTTVKLQDSKASASRILKVSDGWIAAYNQGEFGSAVYWFSVDGKEKKKLSNHQINEFQLEGDRIFAVEGLAHLSMSEGSMIEIQKGADGWKVTEFLNLPSSAEAIARIGEGDFVIVTSDMLLRVNLTREILILIPSADWGGLYPNSVTVDDKFIYVGMRQFVARCELGRSVQKLELLVPDSKWLNTDTK